MQSNDLRKKMRFSLFHDVNAAINETILSDLYLCVLTQAFSAINNPMGFAATMRVENTGTAGVAASKLDDYELE